jgi:hypothetical protein
MFNGHQATVLLRRYIRVFAEDFNNLRGITNAGSHASRSLKARRLPPMVRLSALQSRWRMRLGRLIRKFLQRVVDLGEPSHHLCRLDT